MQHYDADISTPKASFRMLNVFASDLPELQRLAPIESQTLERGPHDLGFCARTKRVKGFTVLWFKAEGPKLPHAIRPWPLPIRRLFMRSYQYRPFSWIFTCIKLKPLNSMDAQQHFEVRSMSPSAGTKCPPYDLKKRRTPANLKTDNLHLPEQTSHHPFAYGPLHQRSRLHSIVR